MSNCKVIALTNQKGGVGKGTVKSYAQIRLQTLAENEVSRQ